MRSASASKGPAAAAGSSLILWQSSLGIDSTLKLGPGTDREFGEQVRCYFLRNARIEAVELLEPGPDENLIEQARALFQDRASQGYECFEVWTGRRFVYRSSEPA
jgi:hypothetical protein